MAGIVREEGAPEFVRVSSRSMSHLVYEALDGEGGVRMAYGAPPLDRYRDFRRVQVDEDVAVCRRGGPWPLRRTFRRWHYRS